MDSDWLLLFNVEFIRFESVWVVDVLKESFLLTKADQKYSKNCEILLQFKIAVFHVNIH